MEAWDTDCVSLYVCVFGCELVLCSECIIGRGLRVSLRLQRSLPVYFRKPTLLSASSRRSTTELILAGLTDSRHMRFFHRPAADVMMIWSTESARASFLLKS